MTDPCLQSVDELGILFRSGAVGIAEVTDAFLKRISGSNDQTNCYISIEAVDARNRALTLENELRSGTDRGVLHGVPFAVKDIFERQDKMVSAGSGVFAYQSSCTATVMRRLEEAGAVILGSLNMDEFAAGGTGDNAHFGRCTNPWDPTLLAGGSSSGSAAAIAACMATATLGSDAGGSIRIPAGYCGVTGLKPTYGRVSRYGAAARTWSMDCIGPLAKSAMDCAHVLAAISGPDNKDGSCVSEQPCFPGDGIALPPDLRIGVDQIVSEEADETTRTIFRKNVHILEKIGFHIEAVSLPDIDLLNDLQQIIVKSEAAALHGRKFRAQAEQLSAAFKCVVEAGFAIPATTYIEALSMRAQLLQEFNHKVFGCCDAFLIPVAPHVVPRHSSATEAGEQNIELSFNECARFTRFANYLGLPAVCFPAVNDEGGPPSGIQLIGPLWSESLLLDIASVFQQEHPPALPPMDSASAATDLHSQ